MSKNVKIEVAVNVTDENGKIYKSIFEIDPLTFEIEIDRDIIPLRESLIGKVTGVMENPSNPGWQIKIVGRAMSTRAEEG